MWFTTDLKVTYRHRASVKALAKQYFHYGRVPRVLAAPPPGPPPPPSGPPPRQVEGWSGYRADALLVLAAFGQDDAPLPISNAAYTGVPPANDC